MSNIVLPHTWAPLEIPTAANWNANEQEIQTKFNTFAFQLDGSKNMAGDILFTDALYDIGKSGATRPRDGFFSRNLTVGGQATFQPAAGAAIVAAVAVNNRATVSDRVAVQFQNTQGIIASIEALTENAGNNRGSLILRSGSGTSTLQDVLTLDSNKIATFAGGLIVQGALPTSNLAIGWDATAGGQIQTFSSKPLLINDSGNPVRIGSSTPCLVLIGTAVSASASAGEVVLKNGLALRSANTALNDTFSLIYGGPNNQIALGAPSTFVAAGGGDVVMPNGKSFRAANVAGTGTKALIQLNTSDIVVLSADGQDILWGAPKAALGGGAGATLGTIGGSGPAVAAQNEWLKISDNAGNVRWIPVWA